jgi:hypothetical protein
MSGLSQRARPTRSPLLWTWDNFFLPSPIIRTLINFFSTELLKQELCAIADSKGLKAGGITSLLPDPATYSGLCVSGKKHCAGLSHRHHLTPHHVSILSGEYHNSANNYLRPTCHWKYRITAHEIKRNTKRQHHGNLCRGHLHTLR